MLMKKGKLRDLAPAPPKVAKKVAAVSTGAIAQTVTLAATLMASQSKHIGRKSGIAGMAAGAAFRMVAKRSPAGAVALGALYVGRKALKARKAAKLARAEKAAEKSAGTTGSAKD